MAESGRTTDVQDDPPTEDYSCGYCLQRWIYMIDQRQLPCSHIFCLPCIKGQINGLGTVHCGICQQEHNVENYKDLPKVKIAALTPAKVETISCDVCKKTPNTAAVFCVECEKKLCERHLKLHDEYNLTFKESEHKILPLGVYSSRPHFYISLKCEKHFNAKLKHACSVCYKMFCSQCTISSERCKASEEESLASLSPEFKLNWTDQADKLFTRSGTSGNVSDNAADDADDDPDYDTDDAESDAESVDPSDDSSDGANDANTDPYSSDDGDGDSHTVYPVEKLAKTLRSSLEEQLKHLSEKITELCKSEKESWRCLSEIEEEAESMREMVIKGAEEKIAAIRKESDQLVAEIQGYLCQSTRTVEVHVADLVANRERLEGVWKSSRQMMSTSHDSQIVQKFVDIKNKVDEEQTTEVKRQEPVRQALVPIITDQVVPKTEEREFLLQLKLCRIPNHLELVDEASKNGTLIYSVNISQSGALLCGTKTGAQIRNLDSLKVEVVEKTGQHCMDIIQPFDDIFVANGFFFINTVEISLVGQDTLEPERKLFCATATGRYMCRLGQCGTNIYLIYHESKLYVHSLISNRETVEYFLPSEKGRPYSLCVLPDSTILIGNTVGNLTRYSLKRDEGLQEIWSLDIEDACNITYEPETELVYSVGRFGVFMITIDGVLLGQLKWDKSVYIRTVHSVAVSKGYIILACKDQGLKKFKIMH